MNLQALYNNRAASALVFVAGFLSISTPVRGQSCQDQESEGVIFFQGESLPIELSGFFPYILDNSTALPLKKYKSEAWNGIENLIVPACSNYAAYDNIVLAGTWTFSDQDFSDTSSKTSTYNGVTTSNIKDGLYRPTHTAPTSREMVYGEPNLSSCGSYIVFHHTNCTEQLSGEFTMDQAMARAEKLKTTGASSDGLQYWNNSSPATVAEALQVSRIEPVRCHAARMSFKVQFSEMGSCGENKILLSFYYKKWSLGQPEPQQYTDVKTEEVEFKTPPNIYPSTGDYQKYPFELKQGEQCKLVRVTARKLCDQHSAGDSNSSNHSVDTVFSLGKRDTGESVGTLELRADAVDPSLYSPAALLLSAPSAAGVVAVKQGEVLRQILTPQSFVDVVTLSPTSYELRYYLLSQVGTRNLATGLYAVSGTPFVTHLIENPDSGTPGATLRLRIGETRAGVQKSTLYSFDSDTNIMTMTTGGGARVDKLEKVTSGSYVTATRTIKDANGKVASVVQEVKYKFPFGLQLVKRVVDPAGLALTTNYGYYEDPGSVGAYGLLRYIGEPTGRWERYTYDSSGRLVGTVSQYLDNAWETPDAQNRQTLVDYGSVADLDGDGLPDTLVTTVTSIAGNETRRSHHITYSKMQTYGSESTQVEKFIDSTVAGAAWDASSNLVTTNKTIVGGRFDGKPATEIRPNGTLTLYQYSETATTRTTLTAQGAPNAANTAVVAGTLTTTVTDLFGNLQATTVKDIASGLELSAQTVTDQDLFGRPTRIENNDGTFEMRSYACCGLENQTGKEGILTHYEYDVLGHVTMTARAGITMVSSYDPDGRLLTLTRQGSDGSLIVQQTNVYNLAGQLISTRDAVGRLTAFAESTNDTKHKIKTTTYAHTGTRIEEYYQDGTLGWVTGTAVTNPARYVTGFDAEGHYTQEIRYGSGGEQSEWQKTYTDMLSRNTKTVYADGSSSSSFYNDAGQLSKTVDPDGVTTLFAYNNLGEQEIVAVDMNRNGAIDLTGTDRITKTTGLFTSARGVTVRRTTTTVLTAEGAASTQDVSITETSVDGMKNWTTVHGLTTQSTVAYPAVALRTETTLAPDGTQAIRQYNNDRLVSQTMLHPSLGTLSSVAFSYDGQGRLQSTTDARSGATLYSYFDDDQIKSVTTPDPDLSRAGPGYDAQTTSYLYDGVGRLYQTTLPDATTVTQEYYLNGQLKKTYGSRTYPQAYTYDGQGRLKTLTTWQDYTGDTGKAVTTWNYDSSRGWLVSKKYADGTGPNYSYYVSGRLKTRTWARGITTTYGYNSAGDLANLTYSDSTPNVSLSYDRLGRLSATRDAAGFLTRTYHLSGQLEDEAYDSASLLANCAVHRSFDALDRISTLTPRRGSSDLFGTNYGYDAASRLQTVAQGAAAVAYGYLPNSSLVGSVTFTNNGTSRLTTTKSYDRMNRLTSIVNTPSASSVSSSAYTYNAANQRTKLVGEDNAYWDFSYDALGQLTKGIKKLSSGDPMLGMDHAYVYDDIGNRKNSMTNGNVSTYTPNLLNQYLQATVPG